MQRYNIYKQLNKGIRTLLFETSVHIQQTDFDIRVQGIDTTEKIKEALLVIERCNHLQSLYILPVVRQYEQLLANSLEKEHVHAFACMTELRQLCITYMNTVTDDEASETGRQILKTFLRFVSFNLEHLPKKEGSLNSVLCNHFSDREIFKLKRMIVGRMDQREILALGKWIIRGVNNTELIEWLKEMQKYVSTEIFRSLCFIAERELPLNRFSRVIDELSEGSLSV
jgi:hypothetical protein